MIELAVSDVDAAVSETVVAALQGVRRRLRVVAVVSGDGARRARLAQALTVAPEGVFETDADLLRHLPVDVYYVPAATPAAGRIVLDAIAAGTHVAAGERLFADADFSAAAARQARACLVKIAVVADADAAPDPEDGVKALADGLIAFADYLEEGLGDYPGKDLIAPPDQP